MKLTRLFASVALATIASAASATSPIYTFTLTGDYQAEWTLPASPTNIFFGDGFEVEGRGTMAGVPDTVAVFAFVGPQSGGGLQLNLLEDFGFFLVFDGAGDVLFTGPSSSPTFKTGTFSLTRRGLGVGTGVLTIAGQAPAIPEPASWALMIAGFGLVGSALRRRAPLPA
jgi:hypothetical protein